MPNLITDKIIKEMLKAIDESTKDAFRKKVWDYMEKHDVANFPRPVHGRIPNFKGSQEAAQNLSNLDIFRKAYTIKVNPDKPQEPVRFLALEARKQLLVPLPRIRSGLFRHVKPPSNASKQELRIAASQQGLTKWGKPIGMDSKIKVDLVVLGSVAVSKEGYRIGKGEGFADLEFAMMMMMGAVDQNTVVASTVHDCQVFETLPACLFKSHDVPVDFIITPHQVIEVNPRLNKPDGIVWSVLSGKKFNEIPILRIIREAEMRKGKHCTLKKEDSFNEFDYPSCESATEVAVADPLQEAEHIGCNKELVSSKKSYKVAENRGNKAIMRDKSLPVNLGSHIKVRISNIASNVRVRDLKTALARRNIKPSNITWNGHSGFADLLFIKSEDSDLSPQVDNIITFLSGLEINSSSTEGLKVEALTQK